MNSIQLLVSVHSVAYLLLTIQTLLEDRGSLFSPALFHIVSQASNYISTSTIWITPKPDQVSLLKHTCSTEAQENWHLKYLLILDALSEIPRTVFSSK